MFLARKGCVRCWGYRYSHENKAVAEGVGRKWGRGLARCYSPEKPRPASSSICYHTGVSQHRSSIRHFMVGMKSLRQFTAFYKELVWHCYLHGRTATGYLKDNVPKVQAIGIYGERGLSKCPFDSLVTDTPSAMQHGPFSRISQHTGYYSIFVAGSHS